jgi:hypothetical protein
MQSNLASLQQKYALLQQDTISKDSRLKLTEEKLAAAQQTVDVLQKQGAQQLASSQALTEKQKAELAAAQQQLAQLSKQREELVMAQQQIASLSGQKAELDRAQAQIAALNAQTAELSKAKAEVASLSAQRSELQQAQAQIAALSAEAQKLEQARAQIAQLTAEKAALMADASKVAQLETARTQTEAGKQEMARLASEREMLMRRVASLEADKAGLEQALSSIETAAGDAPMAARAPVYAQAGMASHEQDGAVVTAPSAPSAMATPQRIVPRVDPVTAEPLPPRGVPSFAQAAPSPASFAPAVAVATASSKLMGPAEIGQLLQRAGINATQGVKAEKSTPQMVAYSWDTGELYGSAEQQAMAGPAQFDTLVQAYLTKTGQRCGGEFGAIPGAMEQQGGAQIASYEIACVTPDGGGASAAMVFYAHDGLFTAVAHETGMDSMDVAMDVRDAVFASLAGAKLASR